MKFTFNKVILTISVVSLSVFMSCKNEEKTPETQGTTSNTEMSDTNSGSAKAPDVNPPHGEPWHRCDIPVGASLSSVDNTEPSKMTTSPIRLKESKPAKNPPHGQPYHDCSIPVGADLKS